MAQLLNTPKNDPKKAVQPFMPNPAMAKIITAQRKHTAIREIQMGLYPFRQSGTSNCQMTEQEKTNVNKAFKPVNPPKMISSNAKI